MKYQLQRLFSLSDRNLIGKKLQIYVLMFSTSTFTCWLDCNESTLNQYIFAGKHRRNFMSNAEQKKLNKK